MTDDFANKKEAHLERLRQAQLQQEYEAMQAQQTLREKVDFLVIQKGKFEEARKSYLKTKQPTNSFWDKYKDIHQGLKNTADIERLVAHIQTMNNKQNEADDSDLGYTLLSQEVKTLTHEVQQLWVKYLPEINDEEAIRKNWNTYPLLKIRITFGNNMRHCLPLPKPYNKQLILQLHETKQVGIRHLFEHVARIFKKKVIRIKHKKHEHYHIYFLRN